MVLADKGGGVVEFIIHALFDDPNHVDDFVNVSHEKSDIHKAVNGYGAEIRLEKGLSGYGQVDPGLPREIIGLWNREAVELADKHPDRPSSESR